MPSCDFIRGEPDGDSRTWVQCAVCKARFPVLNEHLETLRGECHGPRDSSPASQPVVVMQSSPSHTHGVLIAPPVPTLAQQAVVTKGPGTELKKLLSKVGITATPTCSCNARAAAMDANEAAEPGWCEAHLDEIVGWLREEATKRGLPFLDAAGRMLVRRAIKLAKKNAIAKTQATG